MIVNSTYRSGSRKRDSRKQRISWGNNSILANSDVVPISQQRLMDMVTASAHSKRLESAYYPMRLKKNLVSDGKGVIGKLQKFPGVLGSTHKRGHKSLKTKGKSPQSIKAHHNLYIAYIKGNARRIKPVKGQARWAGSGHKTGLDKRISHNLNTAQSNRADGIRKHSQGVPNSSFSMI